MEVVDEGRWEEGETIEEKCEMTEKNDMSCSFVRIGKNYERI